MPRIEGPQENNIYYFREPVRLRSIPPRVQDSFSLSSNIENEGKEQCKNFFNYTVDSFVIQGVNVGLFFTTFALSVVGIIPTLYFCLKGFFTKTSADLDWYRSLHRTLLSVADKINTHFVKQENQKVEVPDFNSRYEHDRKGSVGPILWRGILFTGTCFVTSLFTLWSFAKRCVSSLLNSLKIVTGREPSKEDLYQTLRDNIRNTAHFVQENYL